jgi:hypothetical protein
MSFALLGPVAFGFLVPARNGNSRVHMNRFPFVFVRLHSSMLHSWLLFLYLGFEVRRM